MRVLLFFISAFLCFESAFGQTQLEQIGRTPAQYESAPAEEKKLAPVTESQETTEPNVSEEDTQGSMLAPLPAPSSAAVSVPPVETGPEAGYKKIAILQGLNKVTARISSIEAPIGETVQFGNLEIAVKRCWQAPPTERPENAALMEIWDRKPGETPKSVFHGWMFASSPSLAGLEHPVYDIIVLSCESEKQKNK